MWQRIKNIYHLFVAVFSNIFFGWPGEKLKIIGVTGTDGKTTTVHLIYHILATSGLKVSMISSIGAVINGKEYDTGFHVTTPSSFTLMKFLKKAVSFKSDYFVLEVTSHALDQNRVWGIPFEAGVITNISQEHLDYHKTYEEYLRTKLKLLFSSKIAVVNRDDKSYEQISRMKGQIPNLITYGLPKGNSDFNKYNEAAAEAVCLALGVGESDIKKALMTFELPLGRLDLIYEGDFKVMIDFAHTPNAFEQVLKVLRPKTKGRIIHVFGSAGERDRIKRPVLGEVSSEYSDRIILTAEDPRSEKADKIIEEIASGIKQSLQVQKIPDRQEAINSAIKTAKRGDLVLLTGKAHEKSMNYGRNEEPWDEYEAVAKALKERGLNYE